MGEFPSGQRGQTVNLLSSTSVVRIHPLPPEKPTCRNKSVFQLNPPVRAGGLLLRAVKHSLRLCEIAVALGGFLVVLIFVLLGACAFQEYMVYLNRWVTNKLKDFQ